MPDVPDDPTTTGAAARTRDAAQRSTADIGASRLLRGGFHSERATA